MLSYIQIYREDYGLKSLSLNILNIKLFGLINYKSCLRKFTKFKIDSVIVLKRFLIIHLKEKKKRKCYCISLRCFGATSEIMTTLSLKQRRVFVVLKIKSLMKRIIYCN